METRVRQFFGRITCSVCLQERTPARARVFVVVGEEEGDPAVMGFCYAHAAQKAGSFKTMARNAAAARFTPHPPEHWGVIPIRPRV
ncbi:MAG TPA: hypothetical protein VMV13_04500 [Candidatus Binataceae bacterium]|nr:hypothetical protein [Candidatus Binataceae bacterium]